MSNIIKSRLVNIDSSEKKVINSFEEKKKVVEIENEEKKPISTKDITQILKEREQRIRDEEANLKVKYQHILEVAEDKAKDILEDAKKIAETLKNEAISYGREEGYKKGLVEADEEIRAIKEELSNERNALEDLYNSKIDKFESDFIGIFVALCEKMFGVIIDDKQSVILHVINRTINETEKSNNYIIRVSREDFDLVQNHKQMLYDNVREGANIEIVESDNLTHNRCLIETDNSVIDCSIDTQIRNLISDLQMLSKL